MPSSPDHQHYVRRVVLPSGKTIEVVYFEGTAATAAATAPPELSHCAACASDLVFPVSWDEAGPGHWAVTLRCPNCEGCTTGVYAQETIERLDEQLDAGTDVVLEDLKRLVQANMEDEIARFVSALSTDLIVPEDF